jgi:hypothetical protein
MAFLNSCRCTDSSTPWARESGSSAPVTSISACGYVVPSMSTAGMEPPTPMGTAGTQGVRHRLNGMLTMPLSAGTAQPLAIERRHVAPMSSFACIRAPSAPQRSLSGVETAAIAGGRAAKSGNEVLAKSHCIAETTGRGDVVYREVSGFQ